MGMGGVGMGGGGGCRDGGGGCSFQLWGSWEGVKLYFQLWRCRWGCSLWGIQKAYMQVVFTCTLVIFMLCIK